MSVRLVAVNSEMLRNDRTVVDKVEPFTAPSGAVAYEVTTTWVVAFAKLLVTVASPAVMNEVDDCGRVTI